MHETASVRIIFKPRVGGRDKDIERFEFQKIEHYIALFVISSDLFLYERERARERERRKT
mgnify:CR=1 FL=1